ncbi:MULTISPECIES: cofilin family protein [Streptomyces]|uniref:ADF-H domain-containing protein n=1 Tax=Streptomyces amritsarensis TaxID=681158 RepID=A0ABX3G8A8_9ACTN|nr:MULTISPECIES: cofilin family protein [Streptomyces]AQT70709.1 hypothetical protein B1K54_02275 [Streptomyces sp. fd1-xmd]MDX6759709.1 cofilin family protein [Streptomyces sp. F8]OLZ69591.1 hypothetical protein AVW11_09900 [Streptomyces amritsarensis]
MRSPVRLSEGLLAALRHLRERREINTVTLRYADAPAVLVPEAEGNLTHEELVQALPADEARLVVHELAFASPEGTRRHTWLLILWMPSAAGAQEQSYTAGFTALKEHLPDVRVHLTARRADQLAYRRLVALAG